MKKLIILYFSNIKKKYFHYIHEDLCESQSSNQKFLEESYQYYRSIDFIYDQSFNIIETKKLYDYHGDHYQMIKGKDITQNFHDGLACDI